MKISKNIIFLLIIILSSVVHSQNGETVNNDFDQIVITSSGCFGTCPNFKINLKRNGEIDYFGKEYSELKGLFIGKIDSFKTDTLFKSLSKITITEFENNYSSELTCQNTISLSFIKKGIIIKSIVDSGKSSPPELINWYQSFYNLDIADSLKPNKEYSSPIFDFLRFKNKKDNFSLNYSESFFLWSELKKDNLKQPLISEFTIDFYPFFDLKHHFIEKITFIETDGKRYIFNFKNNKKTYFTLDYNLIDRIIF